MSETSYITDINFDIERYSKKKKDIADNIGYSVLDKMQSMFRWRGLPITIPDKWLEIMLMKNGYAYVTEVEGKLYAFYGGLGGEPDPYYQPTICTIANPALNFNKNCKIGEDGVLISNDTLRRGIIPLIGKYAGLLAENTITIRIADIMARITNIISAGDESTIESAKEYLRQLEEGKLGVIEESPFLEDLKIQAGASQSTSTRLTDLIEMEQYLKASMYNELGLEANYNMKRESINSSEAQLGDDVLQPFVNNMLKCRQEAAEEINKMFGTNITVEFAGPWKDNEDTRELELEKLEVEADAEGQTNPEEQISDNERNNEESEDKEDSRLDNGDNE